MSSGRPRIGLIWAQAHDRVIGKDGVMPWHLREDLAHFKRVTLNHPVIMGRRTWDSIPAPYRPLPGRFNVVITRQLDWQAEGAHRASSLGEALHPFQPTETVWIIGGAQIYAQALPLADEVVVTEIDADFEGDAFAPALDQLAGEYAGKAKIVKVDVDQNQQTALKYHVRSIPMLLLFKGGQVQATQIGAVGKGQLAQMIDKSL